MKFTNMKSFFTGAAFATILLVSFSFYSNSGANDAFGIASQDEISPEQAINYRNNYMAKNPNATAAINISVQQWQALNDVVKKRDGSLRNVAGFRLYFGETSNESDGELVSIPYVINQELEEETPPTSGMPMATGFDSSFTTDCPPFCD